jgi:predicted peroxiredoxin
MENKKFVFILTAAQGRADVSAGAMQLAANMKAFDVELDFFLMEEAVLLAKKGYAETVKQNPDEFSPIHELIKTLTGDFGVKFYVCASCVKHYGLDGAELIPNAEIKPGSFLGEMLLERQSLTF